MSDTRRMLAEMVDPLFAGMGAAATVERDVARLEELGLPNLLVPEAEGGFGGSWLDALTVFRLPAITPLALTCRSSS